MTLHDVGSSFTSLKKFTDHEDMDQVKARCLFIHIALPGQSAEADKLNKPFPSVQDLGLNLVTVLDQLRIQRVVLLGDGAGGNIALRFGMLHPGRVAGLILINTTAAAGAFTLKEDLKSLANKIKEDEDSTKLNEVNVMKYAESFRKRDDISNRITSKVNFDVLLLVGNKSKHVKDSEHIQHQITPGLSSLIKIEGVEDVVEGAPEKLADSLTLFCQLSEDHLADNVQ